MSNEASELRTEAAHLRSSNDALELQLLRDEVIRLRADNARLAAAASVPRVGAPADPGAPADATSRREMLGRVGALAGLAIAGGAAASTLTASPAAAADEALLGGVRTYTTKTTEISYDFPNPGKPTTHVFAAQDGAWEAGVPPSESEPNGTRAAIAGFAGNDAMLGGFFQTNAGTAGAAGVRSNGETANAYGLRTQGRKAAILLDRHPGQLAAPARLDAHLAGEIIYDSTGDLWFCVVAGTPGQWRKLSGPASSGQTHLLPVPVRCYDSRAGLAPLGVVKGLVTEPRLIDCRVTSGGEPAVIPVDATGLIVNVTVTDTTGAGYVAVYPGGSAYSGTSLLNFEDGTTVANSTSVGCGPGATLTVRCGGGVGNIIIDVMGYYR